MKEFKLDNETKITSGFTTPDGYFETFSEKILAQLPKQETKVISFFGSRKTWYYSVAAILILMLSLPIYTKYATNTVEIDSTTLENYISYQSTISQDEIVNLLEPEDLDKIKLDLNLDDKAIEDALKSNTNLEEYLID